MMTPDTWLIVWEDDGDLFATDPAERPRIDAAVSTYVDSCGIRDSLLHVTLLDGREYTTKASRITSWAVSSPETRRRQIEQGKWHDEETERMKHELGMWDE